MWTWLWHGDRDLLSVEMFPVSAPVVMYRPGRQAAVFVQLLKLPRLPGMNHSCSICRVGPEFIDSTSRFYMLLSESKVNGDWQLRSFNPCIVLAAEGGDSLQITRGVWVGSGGERGSRCIVHGTSPALLCDWKRLDLSAQRWGSAHPTDPHHLRSRYPVPPADMTLSRRQPAPAPASLPVRGNLHIQGHLHVQKLLVFPQMQYHFPLCIF